MLLIVAGPFSVDPCRHNVNLAVYKVKDYALIKKLHSSDLSKTLSKLSDFF